MESSNITGSDQTEHTEDEECGYDEGLLGENKQLRENFDNLKEIHVRLQEEKQQLEAKCGSLYNERVEVERQYQQLCESWRQELEEKQKQFEEARAQITQPRDLEVLRLKMLEEVEAPYKQKCNSLAKEAEAAQESFVRSRRENERLKNEMSAMEARQREREDELSLEHEEQLQALRQEIARLRSASVPRAEADRKAAALQQELSHQEVALSRLREEVAQLRKDKESAVTEKDSAFSECEKKLFRLRESESNLSGQVESLLRKNRHLKKQLEDSEHANEKQHASLAKAQAEAKSLAGQLQEAKRRAEQERLRSEERMNEVARHAEAKKSQLTTKIMEKDCRISDLELQIRDKVHRTEAEAAERLSSVREKYDAELRALENENRTLLGKIDDLKAHIKRETESAEEARQRAEEQVSEAKAATQRAQQAADTFQLDKERLRAEAADLRADMERSGRWAEERHAIEKRVDELEGAKASLEQEKQELEQSLGAKEKDLAEYRQLYEDEAAAHVRSLDEAKRSWALEKSILIKKSGDQARR
uniref:BZIP domain-containing protein n=1 Tax=Tetraselmis sp. GSL018 TaxID=582737 RepID=A0A061QQM6_9CHLO